MAESLPMISCICVTRERPLFLKRAFDCFYAQTYPNKELVVLYEDDDYQTPVFLNTLNKGCNVKVICAPRDTNYRLGHLRNLAISGASGDYFCQWDDDDWYHADRLAVQFAGISYLNSMKASVLFDWLIFDYSQKKAYVSYQRLWEGSILCKRVMDNRSLYSNKSYGEDTIVIESLRLQNLINIVHNSPYLYIYTYHGANTWTREHFEYFFENSRPLSPETSNMIFDILEHKYSAEEGSSIISELARLNTFDNI